MLHINYVEGFECYVFGIIYSITWNRLLYLCFCVYMDIVQVNAVITKWLSLLFIKVHDNVCLYCYIKSYPTDKYTLFEYKKYHFFIGRS